jgi:hypothetical protein
MKELLNRIVAGVRSWLGWEDIDETRVSPEHGWLLPQASTVAASHHPAPGAKTADRR